MPHFSVNQYLREFKLDGPFSEPVRLRDLLTHSAGLEERFIGLVAPTAAVVLYFAFSVVVVVPIVAAFADISGNFFSSSSLSLSKVWICR